MHDDDVPVDQPVGHGNVEHREERRQIDDNVLVAVAQFAQHVREALAVQQLLGSGAQHVNDPGQEREARLRIRENRIVEIRLSEQDFLQAAFGVWRK